MTHWEVFFIVLGTTVLSIVISWAVITTILVPKTCKDFSTRQQAQEFYERSPEKYANLDRDRDGKACETYSLNK